MNQVMQHLNSGGVIAYPTETVWGLGARVDHLTAVDKIFAIKARDNLKAVSILVRDLQMAEQYAQLDEALRSAMAILWPGPVAFVLPATSLVPNRIRGGGEFVGLRSSPHPWIREFFTHCDVPIVSTSVNLSGEPPALQFTDLAWLPPEVLKIPDSGNQKSYTSGKGSTVVKIDNAQYEILREGDFPVSSLELILESFFEKKHRDLK